jgi:methyltransferase family protein
MNTLTTYRCSGVVARVFAEADDSDARLEERRRVLPPNEHARLFEPTKVAQARANLVVAGLEDLVEIRTGDALETLARDLPEIIDLVLLDGAKGLYPKVLSLLEPRLQPGALVVADNVDWCPEYLACVRSPTGGYVSVPFASDVELSMKLCGDADEL